MNKLYIILVILIGLIPILWFKGNIIAGEEFYAVDYEKWSQIYSYGWSSRINFGEQTILFPFRFQGIFFSGLSSVGVPYYYALMFWHVILWVGTSLSFYLLLKEIFKDKISNFILFFSTVFYLYNPFFLNISVLLTPPRILFLVLPLSMLILLKYLDAKRNDFIYMIYTAIIFYFVSPIFVNIPYGLMIFVPVVTVIVHKYLVLKFSPYDLTKHILLFGAIFVVLNSWWLLPTMQKITTDFSDIQESGKDFVTIERSKQFDTLSFLGSWAFREKIYGTEHYYFPYNIYYDKFPLVILKYIPLLLIGIGMLSLTKKPDKDEDVFLNKLLVFMSSMFLVFLFLEKGTSGLWGGAYNYIYNNIPFFWMFREPYSKFAPLASFYGAIIMALGVGALTDFLNKKKISKLIQYFVFGSVILAISFPFLTNQIIWDVNDGAVRSYHVKPSESWSQLIRNFKPKSNQNYLIYPSGGFIDRINWDSGYSGNPFLIYTDLKILNPGSGYIENQNLSNVTNYLYKNLLNDPENLIELSNVYNIGGIVFQNNVNDIDIEGAKTHLQKHFDKYKTYENSDYTVYEFGENQSQMNVLNKNSIYKISDQDFDHYLKIRSQISPDKYLKITDDTDKDIYLIDSQNPAVNAQQKTLIYDISAVKNGTYSIYALDPDSNITKIYTDKGEIQTNFEKTLECCELLYIDTDVTTDLKFADDWQIIDVSKNVNNDVTSVVTDKLDLGVKNIGYVKKIENMRDDRQYIVTLDGNYEGNDGFVLEFIEKDNNSGVHYVLSYGKAQNMDTELYFKYNPFSNVLRVSEDTGMYLGITNEIDISTDQKSDVIKPESIDITKLEVVKIYEPQIIIESINNLTEKTSEKFESVEYKEINEYLILGKINADLENNYLQYKQAYNPNWKLVTISQNEFEKYKNKMGAIDYLKILIKSSAGKSSENIEYYSNGWELDESENYFVLVFVPAVMSKVLLWFCILFFTTLITVIIYAKRRKRD